MGLRVFLILNTKVEKIQMRLTITKRRKLCKRRKEYQEMVRTNKIILKFNGKQDLLIGANNIWV